jgi:hypothetical protein
MAGPDALDDDPRFTAVAPLASPAPPRIVIRDCLASVQDVADALIAVEAIDEERADAIMIQLAEALAVRSGTDAALLPRDVYRLAGRCLRRVDHGIAVATVPGVPEPGADGLRIPGLPQPWADVLGTYDGKGRPLDWPGAPAPRTAPATQTAVAAVAAILPEIDGVRFAVAGPHPVPGPPAATGRTAASPGGCVTVPGAGTWARPLTATREPAAN